MLPAAVKTATVQNTSEHDIPPLNVNGLLKEMKEASHGGFLKAWMLQNVLLLCRTLTLSGLLVTSRFWKVLNLNKELNSDVTTTASLGLFLFSLSGTIELEKWAHYFQSKRSFPTQMWTRMDATRGQRSNPMEPFNRLPQEIQAV